MKILKFIFIKMAFGFLFGLGVFLAFGLSEAVKKEIERRNFNLQYNHYTGGNELEIIKHADVRDMREYIVGGEILNNSNKAWGNVIITVSVFKSGILVDTCEDEVHPILESEKLPFSIICHNLSPTNMTDEYTYKVDVTFARHRV